MRARRAFLYTPGNDKHKIQKAITLGSDCICLDLEQGISLPDKQCARENIVESLRHLDFGKSEKLVRINPVRSHLAEHDLMMVLNAKPDGIVLPRVDSAERIHWVSRIIGSVEEDNGWKEGSIKLHATIESAQAFINLPAICDADGRLVSLILGAQDLSFDLGASRTEEGWEMLYARSTIVMHAAAFGLHAIDMTHFDYKNLEKLKKEARAAVDLGFSGKQVIHPDQIKVVQDAFTPSDEAIKEAKKLLEDFTSQQEYDGAYTDDGKLVDIPIVKSTLRLLERARAAGKLS